MMEQEAGDGGFGEPGGTGDLEARQPSAAQSQDASDAEWVGGSGGTFGARTTIEQPPLALGAEASQPFVGRADWDAESGGHLGHRLVEIDDAFDHPGSTPGSEFGLTVQLHAALAFGWMVISQPHLSKSSPHEQPMGTSQLSRRMA